MEIEFISNKLSNLVDDMSGHFDTRKCLTYKAFLNPFRYKVSRLLPAKLHTRRFAVTVSFRRKLLTLRQLSHGQIIYFYFADASARTSSDTASTCAESFLLY